MNVFFRLTLVLWLVLVLAPAGPVGAQVAGVAPAGVTRVRLGVLADGITQVTPADLAAARVDPGTVDPRTFALSSQGQPVAIWVEGEADGAFSGGDRLLFYGERFRGPEMQQKYTDENVYWLEIGGAAGPRMAEVTATPVGDLPAPAHFGATVHAEENLRWWSHETLNLARSGFEDTWFWHYLMTPSGAGKVITGTMPYTVPHPVADEAATLRVQVVSRVGSSANPDHRTTVAVNGYGAIDVAWDGAKVLRVFTATLPAGVLVSGENVVAAGAWNQPDISTDQVLINWWEVDYRRAFRAWDGVLAFTAAAGPQEYQTTGWASPDVAAWDVSDPRQPVALLGATVTPESDGYAVRLRSNAPAGTRYWLQETASHRAPASVRVRDETGLRAPAGGADAVIVTPAALRGPAERLAAWHAGLGRRVVVADFADVCDEFNWGIYHPQAVPQMLEWAKDNWVAPAPQYVTLMGDGHWNLKGYNPALYIPTPVMLPPYLAWVDPWQGEVPADALYGDLDGDAVPDVAVGRLTVNTVAEANLVVDKTLAYDDGYRSEPWQVQALFVSDNPDSGGDFPAVSDEIIAGYLPPDLAVTRAYLPGTPPSVPATAGEIAATRAIISDTLQAGAWLVQYTGHGAMNRWTHENLWTTEHIPGLTNGDRLPVVMTFNCLDGYFVYAPRYDRDLATITSIAELMLRQPAGGSVAAISPTGLGVTTDQTNFRKILMEVIFQEGVRELGPALNTTKARFRQRYGDNYLIPTMTLFGDAALRLPALNVNAPLAPSAAIDIAGSSLRLSWPAVIQDVNGAQTTVLRYRIFRAETPYFVPTLANQVAVTSDLSWLDDGSSGAITPVGDLTHNYFYAIKAVNATGESVASTHVGEFDFALTPGGG